MGGGDVHGGGGDGDGCGGDGDGGGGDGDGGGGGGGYVRWSTRSSTTSLKMTVVDGGDGDGGGGDGNGGGGDEYNGHAHCSRPGLLGQLFSLLQQSHE